MNVKRIYFFIFLCGAGILCAVFRRPLWQYANAAILMVEGKATTGERVEQYGPAVRQRLEPDFERIGIHWPGRKLTLIGLKQEMMLQVWVADADGRFKLLRSYPILKASGYLGPKLREGDRQVPEGLYQIESLNPNSRFHLSLKLNYPNAFDDRMARQDGRTDPGSDIMIHGGRVSIGCLAMGDPAAEDLFVLAAEIGVRNITVILSPADFRNPEVNVDTTAMPDWVNPLYESIKSHLENYTE